MSIIEQLANLAGRWKSTYKLYLSPDEPFHESQSSATVRPLAKGRFVQLDYTWSFKGEPHSGSLVIGQEDADGPATVHWVDSFHMSDKVMACRGAAGPRGAIDVLGSYAAPPGPDWGWRTVIERRGRDGFRLRMFNISPDGREDLAVDASYVKPKVARPPRPSSRRKPRTRPRSRRGS